MASLSLPAGAYAVTATAQLGHSESTFQPVLCRVQLGSEPGSQHGTILQAAFTGNVYTVPLTLSQAGQLTGPGTAQLICHNNSGDATDVVKVDRILMWAVRVEQPSHAVAPPPTRRQEPVDSSASASAPASCGISSRRAAAPARSPVLSLLPARRRSLSNSRSAFINSGIVHVSVMS